jgi:hypothetical protein
VCPLDVLPGYLVEVESLWLLVALDCQCIFRQALLYLESNDAVESAELVVGDYLEVDWKLVGKFLLSWNLIFGVGIYG